MVSSMLLLVITLDFRVKLKINKNELHVTFPCVVSNIISIGLEAKFSKFEIIFFFFKSVIIKIIIKI